MTSKINTRISEIIDGDKKKTWIHEKAIEELEVKKVKPVNIVASRKKKSKKSKLKRKKDCGCK